MDNSEIQSNNKLLKKWRCTYNSKWENFPQYSGWIRKSKYSNDRAFCQLCHSDFSIASGGRNDVDRHRSAKRHTAGELRMKTSQAFVEIKQELTGIANKEDYSTGVYIYNKEWESIPLYSAWLNQSSQSKSAAYCAQCNCDFSIAKRGIEEIERHLVEKHLDRQFEDAGPLAAKRWCDSVQTSPEMNQSLSLIQRDDRSPENPDPNYHETNQPRQRQFPNVVTINVGGHIFKTRLSTLTKYPNSMLAAMFSGRHTIDKDEDGLYFIDSNGSLFGYILDYLRRDKLPPTHAALDIYKEALYFGLDSLVQKLSLNPSVCSILVRESIRQQFPNYEEVKMNMIKVAASTCTVNRTSQVNVYAFKTIVQPKLEEGDSTHECIASKADIIFGPWDSSPDEDAFVTCLENDLREEGFTLNEGSKKRCRYYQGLFSCPKTLYMFNFSFL